MANLQLDDLVSNLGRVRIRGEIIEGDRVELVGRQVEVVIEAIGSPLETTSLSFGTTSVAVDLPQLPQFRPFVLSPLAASRLGTQRWAEPGTKVLGPRSIEYWGRGGGFHAVQTLKAQRGGYISPKARHRGFVHFEEFIVERDVIVVKNQGLRSHAEWIWSSDISTLPLFSLAFTEFWNGDYSFHTIWHKEESGWIERATRIMQLSTNVERGFEIATTIYYPARPGTGPLWGLYAP